LSKNIPKRMEQTRNKNKKNIFKSATLISNGAFLGLAAGVYLGIIDP